MPDALSRSYARFVSCLRYDDLPDQVVDKIQASVLHAMVVSIIGAQTNHGQSAIALTKEEDSKPDGATILVDGTKATRGGAAFAKWCMGRLAAHLAEQGVFVGDGSALGQTAHFVEEQGV